MSNPFDGVDAAAVAAAVRAHERRIVPGIDDMATYLAAQVGDTSPPRRPRPFRRRRRAERGRAAPRHGDRVLGNPERPEMAFSATKSVLALVAGIAFDDGPLRLDEPVVASVALPQLGGDHGRAITWRHLLDHTSRWEGELWVPGRGVGRRRAVGLSQGCAGAAATAADLRAL